MFQTMVATDSASDAESYSEIIATNRESKFSLFYLISFKNTLHLGPLSPEIRTRITGKNSVSVGLRRLKFIVYTYINRRLINLIASRGFFTTAYFFIILSVG